MLRRRTISWLVSGLLMLGALVFSGFGLYSFQRDLSALETANQEDITWSAMQLEMEVLRFRDALRNLPEIGHDEWPRQLQNRFDILWSRVNLFQRGRVGERLRHYDAAERVVPRLLQTLRETENDVITLSPADPRTIGTLRAAFAPYPDQMRELSRRIFVGEEEISARIRAQMRVSARQTLALSIIAVLFFTGALVYVLYERRGYKRLAEHNRELALEASRASRAKSRFLSMMSHELRTPMNGVLGLLALARQHGAPEPQARLLGQAERSAQQMIDMLTDILDFSALQSADLELEDKPFDPRLLLAAVEDLFSPIARREGISFAADCAPAMPAILRGDFGRLRQSLVHLAGYFVETAGARDFRMSLSHDGQNLVSRFSFDYALSGAEWTPDLIFGTDTRAGEGFATDALGPAVARGLIERMGGAIRLDSGPDNRIAVQVCVPLAPAVRSIISIWLEVQSKAMETICRAALRDDRLMFVTNPQAQPVDLVVLEASGTADAARVAALRARFPAGLVLALGHVPDDSLFDIVIETPLDVAGFRGAVLTRLAG